VKSSECAEFFRWDFLPIDIIINIFTINKFITNAQVGTARGQGAAVHLPLRQELLQLRCPLHPHQAKASGKGTLPLTQAPGAITKPKSENKRGRPRKNPLPCEPPSSSHPHTNTSHAALLKDTGTPRQFNSKPKKEQQYLNLKSTPGSQFKQFKKDSATMISSQELPSESQFEEELLRDLSRYL
jgi:hypothetical protein